MPTTPDSSGSRSSGRLLRVHGQVQGVGFRWWTRSLALRLGIQGSVRNCDDGTVEIAAFGPLDSLNEFCVAIRQGPPGATVNKIDEAFAATGSTADSFKIVP